MKLSMKKLIYVKKLLFKNILKILYYIKEENVILEFGFY